MIIKKKINTYKVTSKFGVSLIILVITIVIILIFISTIIISTKNAVNLTDLATFAKNLTEVQDAVKSYYIVNNIIPELNGSVVMDRNKLLLLVKNKDILIGELTENNDLDSQFYTIDLVKINVTQTSYGNKKLGDNDIFVISYPSLNVYYLYGLYANDTTYFSLTSKITKVVKIPQVGIYDSVPILPIVSTIKVSQNIGWVNEMNINLEVDMLADETLYMSVSGDTNKLIITTVGKNIFKFNLLSSIVNNTETIKVPTLTMTEANYIELGTKPISERYIDILKYKNNKIVERKRIDLSNFSKIPPTVISATITSYLAENRVDLLLNSAYSGIKEVRYEYLTKYNDNGTINNYYTNISDFDPVYMKEKAKKTEVSNNSTATIKAPKYVQSIKITISDKAGNISSYNQEIAPRLYIGYLLDSYTKELLQLTAKVFSINGIKTISFSRSFDGIYYSDEQIFTLNVTNNGITTVQCNPFINIQQGTVYIKIVAVNYDGTVTETRIVKVDLEEPIINLPYTTTKPQLTDINKYKKPYIPPGFTYKEGTWDTGLVIDDNLENEFVWVPVDGTNVIYKKWTSQGYSYNNAGITNDSLPVGITDEEYQIINFGGFYIARYEAGKEGTNTVVSKKNALVWQRISYVNSKLAAQSMYNNSVVSSGLITGTQWDTVMMWIQNSGKNIIDSRSWGNYKDSITPANVSGYKKLQLTGYSEFWKSNNIYDLAGNILEWSSEIYQGNSAITRGGFYGDSGSISGSSFRGSQGTGYQNTKLGFRCVLYIK